MPPTRRGSVRQRGESWQARWQAPDGTTHSSTHPTERAAERWLRRLIGESEKPATSSTYTFEEWAEIWLNDLTHLRPSSLARAQSACRSQLIPAYGTQPIDQITTADVRTWTRHLVAQGLAPSTVLRLLRVLGACLQVAAEDGHIPANPARGIKPPPLSHREQRYLTPAEVETLAQAIDPRYSTAIYVLAYGGVRIGELAGLRRRHVSPMRGEISIVEQVVEIAGHQTTGAPKSAAGRRTIPLPRFVMEKLNDEIKDKGPDDLVFTAPEGGQLRRTIWAARIFRPAVEAAGLTPLRLHDLRHTAVALWIAAGASPLEVARRAGHSSTSFVLDRYGHLYAEGLQATTDRLDEIARRAAEDAS